MNEREEGREFPRAGDGEFLHGNKCSGVELFNHIVPLQGPNLHQGHPVFAACANRGHSRVSRVICGAGKSLTTSRAEG